MISKSKYIIKFIGHFVFERRPYIVTYFYKVQNYQFQFVCFLIKKVIETFQEGDLKQFIKKTKENNKKIDLMDISFWSKQMVKGLDYLHSNGIIHRDLKPSNIFIYGGSLVLGDIGFESSTKELNSSNAFRWTLYYACPEVINEQAYDFKADIW